ncbi:SigE family RNA polymerase sigma factor [Streptomyces murinus]|uniref:RNA polymerase sigma-70 factor (Sigma-E family) n=2 Tax=Streptomyces murinus TaxID=33900 RepID=A0A7W3NQB7_STRMR|nr:SigE family RNA polymerase sigma factor [Streptomyces murinus]MBA9054754.1 RNA polymerase sigma-70 factor (sigma-E family) [Streptomyces murinus]UWW89425.1 SigE family RNA polymerase sigma factor [Streptomyces murinus]
MEDGKQDRDEEFGRFMTARWSRLLRTAFLLTGEPHSAEDLAQSTLERAYTAWRRVGTADDPDAYVRRVMINLHARRHRRRLKEFLAPKDDSGLVREEADRGDRITQAVDREVLLRAPAQLPARQRQAVVLRYWEDLTETQTAQAMGCSVGTVKSNTAKGTAKLRLIPALADAVPQGGRA